MVFELFRWWYGAGWLQTANSIRDWPNGVRRSFSTPLLIKTLFAPWKRITSISGRSFDDKVRASVDNFVSRLVGFVSRLLVLIAAGLLLVLTAVFALIATVIWPLIPLAIIFCVIKAITG